MTVRELLKKDLPRWAAPSSGRAPKGLGRHNRSLKIKGSVLRILTILIEEGWEACLYDAWIDLRKEVDGTMAHTTLILGPCENSPGAFVEHQALMPWESFPWLGKV